MISINELREICQSPRRECDTWYGINICRRFSIYLTRFAVIRGITADMVTLVFVIVGLVACGLLAIGSFTGFIIGIIGLHFWYFIDHVDGEIARYTNTVTVTGIYFDKIGHFLVHPSIFFFLGVGLFKINGNFLSVITGFWSGLSVLLISEIKNLKDATIYQKAVISNENIFFSGETPKEARYHAKKIYKSIFSYLHKICTFPYDLIVLTGFLGVTVLSNRNLMDIYLYAYAVISTLVLSGMVFVSVSGKTIDKEWEGLKK